MPADVAFGMGLLDEEGRSPHEDIGPENGLNCIEDAGMADDLMRKAEDYVRVVELALVAQLIAARPQL